MARYHINAQGEAGPCRATKRCPFGDLETDHYSTKEEAREAYEKRQTTFPVNPTPVAVTSALAPLKPVEPEDLTWLSELENTLPISGTVNVLGMLDTELGPLVVTHLPLSNQKNDRFVQEDSGIDINVYELRVPTSGESVAYLKLSIANDESMERSFGPLDDPHTPIRYMTRYRGHRLWPSDYDKPGAPAKPKPEDPEEWKKLAQEVWQGVFNSGDWGEPPSAKRLGLERSSWAWEKEDVPSNIEDLESDLQAASKKMRKEMNAEYEWNKTPFVDYSRVEKEEHQGKGLGAAVYYIAGKELAKTNQVIRGSGLQSESAQALWQNFRRHGAPVGEITSTYRGTTSTYPTLDFRQ